MHSLDYITIVIFTLGILLAGVSFSKSGKNMKSFFAADGQVPWWIGGLSLFMGFFSAGTFVVWGSIAYTHGWVAVTIQSAMCVAGFGVALFIAPKWRDTGVLTAAEYVEKRLGKNVHKMYTFLFLLISMFTTGSFLYPVAKIVQVSTGVDLQLCIILLGCFSILYVTIGGLWAVMVTDVLQFVILTAAVVIAVPLSLDKAGGLSHFISSTPNGFFNLFNGEYTVLFIVAFCLYNLFFLGGNWSYVQRYTTVSNRKDARKVGLLFGTLYILCPVLWMLPPMIYRVLNPSLMGTADEGAYLLMCKMALPQGLLGLILGGMIFATASSLNGTLNISAGVFTHDIYRHFFKDAKEKSLMRVARYSTIGFGLIAIFIALLIPKMGGIVNVVISLAALTGVPLYLPIIWTLFSKRQNSLSVMSATLISLLLNTLFKFVTPYTVGLSLSRGEEMATGVAFPIIILTIFEFINSYKGYTATYQSITSDAAIQEESTEVIAEGQRTQNNQSLYVIGIGICSTGAILLVLDFFTNFGQLIIGIIATILIILGLLGMMKARKS